MSSSVPVNVVNTQWSNPLLFQQRCDKTVERKILIMLSCEQNKSKPISWNIYKLLQWLGWLFVRFQTVSISRLQTRKKKLPPPQKSSPGNTNLHLIRFFSWNCHRSIQYTDWSCDNRQNFKTQLFDLSDQGCPKSLHQHHQRAGRVKGWGLKLSLVTTHTESHCSEGLGRHNAESLYTWK